jgi:hypothetical protein
MRIPVGNFGFQTPQTSPTRVEIGGVDAVGRGMQHLGDIGMQASAAMMAEKRREDEALARAKASNALLDREIAVDSISKDLEQQIATGALHYGDASKEYQKRVAGLGMPDMTGLDPATTETFQRGLKRVDFKGIGPVDRAVAKAQHDDLRAQTDGILDKLGKKASLPGADPTQIIAESAVVDETGHRAYGAAWAKKKQDWQDSAWDSHLNQQAMTVRDDLQGIKALEKQITSGDYADKLDSNKRNTIIAKLEGYRTSLIQRQEAEAARAQREQERYLKRAEAEFNTFQALSDKGTILAPDYIERVSKMTAGTPYQQGITMLAKQAQETGGIAAQPVRQQQQMLDQVDTLIAKQGRTPELDKRREQLQKVLDGSTADLKANGLRAGLERGVITEMAPIDISTPEAFAASVANRIKQAETVGMWAGKAVSPLDSHEAESVAGMLEALPPKAKSQAVSTISAALGARLSGALSDQLDKQDRALSLAFQAGSSRTPGSTNWLGTQTIPERYTSELILKGSQAIKDGAVMKDDKKVTGWKATIAEQVNGAFPDEKTAKAAKEAAYYITAGIASENGGTASTSEIKRAVKLAIGGDIIERNGKKLPIPAGMDESTFEDKLKAITPESIKTQATDGKVRVAGVEMEAGAFVTSLPGQELMYAGPGRYAVIVRGRPVMSSAGKPIIIKVQ